MRGKKTLLSFFLLFQLSGCAYLFGDEGLFPGHQNDYLGSKEADVLQLPEGVDSQTLYDAYPVPELEYASVLPERYSVPRVQSLGEVESKGTVRIQNLDGERWLLINRAPTQVRPLLVKFLEDNNIALSDSDKERNTQIADAVADKAVIETAWLKDADLAEGYREKYRFVLRSGVQQNTTEIVVKQQEQQAKRLDWRRSSNLDRESSMAKVLAEFLASSPDQLSHSLLAQGISTASKVNLVYTEKGKPYLALQLSYVRGWAALGLALPKASFVVVDKNYDQGLYFSNYEPSKDKKTKGKRGFWSRVKFWGKQAAKERQAKGDYLISIKSTDLDAGKQLTIEVDADNGEPLQYNEQAYLLNKILAKLS